jgi:hypothetical protein
MHYVRYYGAHHRIWAHDLRRARGHIGLAFPYIFLAIQDGSREIRFLNAIHIDDYDFAKAEENEIL